MFSRKTINKKETVPKKAATGPAEAFEEGAYYSELYVGPGLHNGARDYTEVEARITATLQAGKRQFKDPDGNFHAQLKVNYWRLLRDKKNAQLIHINKKNKLQNRLKIAEKSQTQQLRGLDITYIPLEQSLAGLLDVHIEYKYEHLENITEVLDNLDNQLLSHETSRNLLKASGADPQEALRGSIIDAMLSQVLLQLVKLPVTLGFSTAGAQADLSSLEKSTLREAGTTNKTVLGEVLKPSIPSLSRGARIVNNYINADKVSPETEHALTQFINQIKLQSKVSHTEEHTAAFEELKAKIYQQYQTMLEKKAYYKNLTSAGKKKYLNAALQVAGFLIQISGRAVGHATLLSVGAEQLTKFITLVVRPAIAGLSTVIENWYDERAIATSIQRQFNRHMQSIMPGEAATEEFINKLAHEIQENFEPAPLANYNRLNENVFQPELLKLDEDIQYLESKIHLLNQRAQAHSLRELALIGKKEMLLQAYGSYIKSHSRKYIDFDRAIIEGLISLIQHSNIEEADAIGLFELNLHAIFGLLALGEEKNNQLIGALNNAFEGEWGRTLMEVIPPLAEKKLKSLEAYADFSDEMLMEGIYVTGPLESDRHFSKAYKNFRRQSELEKIRESIKQLRDQEANVTPDKTLLSKRQAAEKKRIELSNRLIRKLKKRDTYQKDVAAFLARDRSGISEKGQVWWAIANNERGVVSAISRGLKDAPRRAFHKLSGRSDKPYQEGLIAAFKPFTSNMVLSPGLVAAAVIRESRSSPTPDVHKSITAPLEMLMASFSAEHTGGELNANNNTVQQQTPFHSPPTPTIFSPPSAPEPGVNHFTPDIGLKSSDSLNFESPTPVREDMPTSAPKKDLSRHRRSAPSSEASCRIIDPAELDLIEKGFDQLDEYKKKGGWGEYDIRYVHPADSNGNMLIDLRHSVSGQRAQTDISAGEQANMGSLGAVADYYAQETADLIADPDVQNFARKSLGLPKNTEFRSIALFSSELSVRYFDPVLRSEQFTKVSLEDFGLRVAKQMSLESVSIQPAAKAGDLIGKGLSFISLVTQGYPQDVQSGLGYVLNLADSVESAAMAARQISNWVEGLPFSRTVGTLIKLGTHDLIKAMSKAAPILAAVGVGLGIQSIIDLSREYLNAAAPRQKAIAADLFFAVTGTVGGVGALGAGLAGLPAAGPAGLALAIVAALGMGISYLVNRTAQTEDRMINAAKQGAQFLQKLQTPMTVNTEGGHTTITLHRPGSLRIADGRAIFTPDPGSAQIQKVIASETHYTPGLSPITPLMYGVYENLETYMDVNEVSVAIPQPGSLTVLDASKQIKVKPVYSPWIAENRNYPDIREFENLLETISSGSKRPKVFTTTLVAPMGSRTLTGFEIEHGPSVPSRISSDRPYVRYDSDNASNVEFITIQGGGIGITTGVPAQSVLNVGSAGGQVSVILPESIQGKETLQVGAPKFETLPTGQLRISRTMRLREKTAQQIKTSEQELERNPFSPNYYKDGFNNAIRFCKASWVSRSVLRYMLTRYRLWCEETLPSAAFISELKKIIDVIPHDPVDAELLAALNAVPKGQKLTDNERVKKLLLQYKPGIKNGYPNRSALESVEHVLNQRLQDVMQHGKDRDGADQTWTSDVKFSSSEDFTFRVNDMSSNSVDTYLFEVKKDGTFTQAEKRTSARPVSEEPAPPLPKDIDLSLYGAGENIGTQDEPEYVYRRHDGTYHKLSSSMPAVTQLEPVGADIVKVKRATRGLLRDLTAILKWAKAQQSAIRYFKRAHFDGPSLTVDPGGYLATHYATSLRTGANGSNTMFLRQIPSALTGFRLPALPTEGEEDIYLTFDNHQANITALEAKINRLKQHRSSGRVVNNVRASKNIHTDGVETFSFDSAGIERIERIFLADEHSVFVKLLSPQLVAGNLLFEFLDNSRASRPYAEVIQIQAGEHRYFYRPKTRELKGPLSADGQAVVYLGQGADGHDVYGLEDTTKEFAHFSFDALNTLTRTHRFTRQLLQDYGILDPVAGPQWITGRGGAKLRIVTTLLGGDAYVLEDVDGATHARIKGASNWTVGVPNTASGLEAVVYGFDINDQAGVTLLRAQNGKKAQYVGIKTDQISPVRVGGGANVLLQDDFNRPLTFDLSAQSSNVLELNWSQWTLVPQTSNVTDLDSLTLVNAHGGRVVIVFAPGATLSVRDINEEDFSLDARPYTSPEALTKRLATSTPDVAMGSSNLGELYWDPLRKTLMAQQGGATRELGTLSAPVNYLDAAGTQVGIYADVSGNTIELPTLGMKTYEVGLGKSNKLTLSRSFVENARAQSGGETYVYPNLETLAAGEHALVKLDPTQWPAVGGEIALADGSVIVNSQDVPPVVLRFIPPKGKRIQLSLLEGSTDTWKATVIDPVRGYASSETWGDSRKNRAPRSPRHCVFMPASLLRPLRRRRNKSGEAGNPASRIESLMQSNQRNAQGLETGDKLEGISESNNSSSQSASIGEAASFQASSPKKQGGQDLLGRLQTKMRGGESSSPATSSVSPINALALDRKIDSASKSDPAGYSFICYRAAFNNAKQAGVIDARLHEWLTNSVAKRGSNGEIIDSPHYREVFSLQNKIPMTRFEHANINESGFMHLGKRQPNGSVVYEHAVYVHVVGGEIHLYQVNGSSFIVALNGADGPNKHNNIGKNVSKSHYKHYMDAGRIANFNNYFVPKAGDNYPQPVFAFTPTSEVRSAFSRQTTLSPESLVGRNRVENLAGTSGTTKYRGEKGFAGRLLTKISKMSLSSTPISSEKPFKENFANSRTVNSTTRLDDTSYRTAENLIASGSIGKVYKNGERLMKDYSGHYDAIHKGRLENAKNNVEALNRLYGKGAAKVILRDTIDPSKKTVSVDMLKVPGQSLESILRRKDVTLAREVADLYRSGGVVEGLVGLLRTNGIVWHDINLGNIMYDSQTKTFNLIDFDAAHINDPSTAVNDGQAGSMSKKFTADFENFVRQTAAMGSGSTTTSVQSTSNVELTKNNAAGRLNTLPVEGKPMQTSSIPLGGDFRPELEAGGRSGVGGPHAIDERGGTNRTKQIRTAVERINLDRNLTSEEQRVVDGGFITKKHLLAIAEAAHFGNFHVSFRNTGSDALSWIERGAATKPHSILEKTLKSDRVPQHLRQAVIDSGLLGLAAHWETGVPTGVFVTREAALLWRKNGGPQTLGDGHGNFYVPINFSMQTDFNLVALKALPVWERTVITGDYDMHDNVVRGGSGGAHTAVSDSTEEIFIKNALNSAISVADRSRVGAEHLMIQHGAQVNYPAHVMNHESARDQLIPAVARPSFPLAFVDNNRRWTIVNTQAELETYYASHNVRIKETWKEGGLSQFVERGTGTLGIGSSAQLPSQGVVNPKVPVPEGADGRVNAGYMNERYSARTENNHGNNRKIVSAQSENIASEEFNMTVRAQDVILVSPTEIVTIPNSLTQFIKMGNTSQTLVTYINFSVTGRAVIDPNLTGDLVLNFTSTRGQVVEVHPDILLGMEMIEDRNIPKHFVIMRSINGKSLRILVPKNPAAGAIHVKGHAAPFVYHSEQELKVGFERKFKPFPPVAQVATPQRINGQLGYSMGGEGTAAKQLPANRTLFETLPTFPSQTSVISDRTATDVLQSDGANFNTNLLASFSPLIGSEPYFDTAILGGDPIGRKDIGFNVPLPAQPEAFKQVVNEKIIAHSSNPFEIKIDVWLNPRTGRTHIMDGQHRFIAAAKLGVKVKLNWKKFGIAPTQVGWCGTEYVNGTAAKETIKANKAPHQ